MERSELPFFGVSLSELHSLEPYSSSICQEKDSNQGTPLSSQRLCSEELTEPISRWLM